MDEPNHEAAPSTAALPGRRKSGRKTCRAIVPMNSMSPKSVRNGSRNDAKTKTIVMIVMRSFRITPPVSPDVIQAGPAPKRIMQARTAATARTATEARDTANRAASPFGLRDHAGRTSAAYSDTSADRHTMATVIAGSRSPSSAPARSVRMPSPMLRPSAVGYGARNIATPRSDGSAKRRVFMGVQGRGARGRLASSTESCELSSRRRTGQGIRHCRTGP